MKNTVFQFKISDIAIMLTALFCLGYYVIIVSYAGFSSPLSGLWLFAFVAFFLAEALLAADRKFDFLRLVPKWLLIVPAAALLVGGALFMLFYSCVLSTIHAYPQGKADYCIVLGAQIRGENLTRSLRYRLDEAYEYYTDNTDCIIIVSGGQGEGESIPEAAAMSRYLISKGVPEDKIILEDKSVNTKQNLKFSYEIVKGGKGENSNVVICSNDFHIFRSVRLAKTIGYENVEGLAAKSDEILKLNYMIRDSLAIFKEILMGNIRF